MLDDNDASPDAQLIRRGLMMVIDAIGDLRAIVLCAQEQMTQPVRLDREQIQEIAKAVIERMGRPL